MILSIQKLVRILILNAIKLNFFYLTILKVKTELPKFYIDID
jgi:hypothetical protein